MRYFTLSIVLLFTLLNSLSAQWESLGSGTTTTPRDYFALDVVDAQIMWATTLSPSRAATNEVVRSIDGGQTWEVSILPTLTEAYTTAHVQAIDENIAWVSMINLPTQDKSKIFKTTDGGVSWTEQTGEFNTAGHTAGLLHAFDENEVLNIGSPGTGIASIDSIHIFKTFDGGSNWDRITRSALPELLPGEGQWLYSGNGSYESKGDTLWFVSRKSRVFRTTDRGATWEAFDTGIHAGQGLSSIAFEDELNGIVVGTQPNRAARTEDGGETWTEITIPLAPFAGSIEYVPDTKDTYLISAAFYSPGTTMAISRDGGMNWATPDFGPALKCIQFISPTLGIAGSVVNQRENTGLFKWTGDLSDPLYVNHAATGSNNGKSWEDAFIDLQSALAAADSSTQIWVAQGTYSASRPSMLPDTAYFQDTVGVKLYGGFKGEEIHFEDRDTEEFLTVLSADLMGDDLPNNFEDNREDNAYHVLTSIHSNNSVLDGFTISGGHGLLGPATSLDFVGGGVYSTSNLVVNNCIFIHNQSAQGAAMTGEYSALTVTNCLFKENNSNLGGLLILNGTGAPFLVSGNRFEGNVASDWGGAMTVFNCEAIIENNVFEANVSYDLGGGLVIGNAEATMDNNIFENNSSAVVGGGLFVFQNDFSEGDKLVSLTSNQFLNNSSDIVGGGIAFNNFNNNSVLNITDCHFEGNTAVIRGGAARLYNGIGAMGTVFYTLSSSFRGNTFVGNSAGAGGGLYLSNQADEMSCSIISSTFENNTATENGGAINAVKDGVTGQDIDVQMEDLTITGNSAAEKGGGLYLDVGLPSQLLHSVVKDNSAAEGAALYLQSSSEMRVENTLVADNIGNEAIHNKGTLRLLGVTCVGNDAGLYQEGSAAVSFQNTIMANSENYIGRTGNHTSQGGNLSSDATLVAAFTGLGDFQDLNEKNPLLGADFIPSFSSPCIDAGNPNDVTVEEDLAGNDRVQRAQIDIGAYESPFATSTKAHGSFKIAEAFPNPFIDEIRVTSDKPVLSLTLFDVQGRIVVKQVNGSTLYGLEALPAGIYLLKIATAKGFERVKIIKG